MSVLANYYGDLGKDTLGGYIFTAVVMVSLIVWVLSIYVQNFGPKAKAREAAEAQRDAARRMPTPTS